MVKGFVTFVREQGVVGIAVGIAIGVQAAQFVSSIVTGFISPLVGVILQGNNLNSIQSVITVDGEDQVFAWGWMIQSFISFIATAFVVYFLVKQAKLDKLDKKSK